MLEQFRRLVFPVNVGYSYILMFTGLAAWRASSLQSSETGRGAWSATAGVLGVSAGHELYRMYAKTGGLVIHGRKENITAEEVKQGMKEWMRWHRIRIGLTGMASMVALYAMAGEWGKWGKFADEEKKNEELVVKWPFQKSDKS